MEQKPRHLQSGRCGSRLLGTDQRLSEAPLLNSLPDSQHPEEKKRSFNLVFQQKGKERRGAIGSRPPCAVEAGVSDPAHQHPLPMTGGRLRSEWAALGFGSQMCAHLRHHCLLAIIIIILYFTEHGVQKGIPPTSVPASVPAKPGSGLSAP